MFKTAYNYNKLTSESQRVSEVDPVSVAVPNQSLTIKEILRRFACGMKTDDIAKTPIYDSDQGLCDIDCAVNTPNYDPTMTNYTSDAPYTKMRYKGSTVKASSNVTGAKSENSAPESADLQTADDRSTNKQ